MGDQNTIYEQVKMDAPRGTICGKLGYRMDTPTANASLPGGVLILSPHPFMGGHMELPLLKTITDRVVSMGIPTLRFDYGGVGHSEGEPFDVGSAMDTFWKTGNAPQDPVLIEEARGVRDWFTQQVHSPIVLVGCSFGAYVATQIRDKTTPAIVLVAPTIMHHDYAAFTNNDLQTLIVGGEDDFATDDEQMISWADALSETTRFEQIAGSDHFFRKSSNRVAELVGEFLAHLITPSHQELS